MPRGRKRRHPAGEGWDLCCKVSYSKYIKQPMKMKEWSYGVKEA